MAGGSCHKEMSENNPVTHLKVGIITGAAEVLKYTLRPIVTFKGVFVRASVTAGLIKIKVHLFQQIHET